MPSPPRAASVGDGYLLWLEGKKNRRAQLFSRGLLAIARPWEVGKPREREGRSAAFIIQPQETEEGGTENEEMNKNQLG